MKTFHRETSSCSVLLPFFQQPCDDGPQTVIDSVNNEVSQVGVRGNAADENATK